MPVKDADFTRDDVVSWHAIEEAERNGAERIVLSAAQVRMLTTDVHAVAAGRKRADESAFRVPPTTGLTCVACYGPACMSDGRGRAYCFEHSLGRAPTPTSDSAAVIDSLRKALLAAEVLAEERRALAKRYSDRLEAVEQERAAMALALVRKEIAK